MFMMKKPRKIPDFGRPNVHRGNPDGAAGREPSVKIK